jgi:hypothetical protein
MGRGGGTNSTIGIGNSDASVLSPVDRMFFIFCLYTAPVIVLKMFLFFIFPIQLRNQNTYSYVEKNIRGASRHPLSLPPRLPKLRWCKYSILHMQTIMVPRWKHARKVHVNLWRVETDTDRYRPIQTDTDRYRPIQTDTDWYRPIQTNTDWYRPMQTDTDRYRPIDWYRPIDRYRPIQTDTDRYRLMQTDTDWHRLIQTDTDR